MNENTPDPGRAVEAAERLTGSLNSLSVEVARLNSYGRRNRHLIWGTIISLAIDVALTVAVAVFAIEAHQANVTVAELHATQISACRLGNQSRSQQVALWVHIATVSSASPPPHESKKQLEKNKRTVAALLAYIRRVFAPRDCQAIYRLP